MAETGKNAHVRIIKSSTSRVPPTVSAPAAKKESWYTLARYALPVYLLAGELKESIGEQFEDGPQAIVDLDVPPGVRELWLELLHMGVHGEDFETSREEFLASFEGAKRARLKVVRVDEPWVDDDGEKDDEDHWFRVDIYSGRKKVGSRRLRGFTAGWEFDAVCWFFYRVGVNSADVYRTMSQLVPGYEEIFSEDG